MDKQKIYYNKETKGCAIIFESSLGGDYLHWQNIQKKLSKEYTKIHIIKLEFYEEISAKTILALIFFKVKFLSLY